MLTPDELRTLSNYCCCPLREIIHVDQEHEPDIDQAEMPVNELSLLIPGKFVAFKRTDDAYLNTVHIAKIVNKYNASSNSVLLEHWVDLELCP